MIAVTRNTPIAPPRKPKSQARRLASLTAKHSASPDRDFDVRLSHQAKRER
jgi:hypothetical protein